MNQKSYIFSDPYAFSLTGLRGGLSNGPMPVVNQDRINKAWDEKLSRPQVDQPDTAREIRSFWQRAWGKAFSKAA